MAILILEDDNVQANYYASIIKKSGISLDIHIANTITQASLLVKTKTISILLLDVNLPDGSGIDFVKSLLDGESLTETWIIVISSNSDALNHILKAYQSIHCYHYLTKPINELELMELVKKLSVQKIVKKGKKISFIRKNISYILPENEILYLETLNRTGYIHTIEDCFTIKPFKTSDLLNQVENKEYIKVHKSYTVKVDKIISLSCIKNQWFLMLKCDKLVPVSKNYLFNVKKFISLES